jgi:hypothetical protein
VREAFRPWEAGDSGLLFALVADDVRWTVIGSTPASGVFESKQALVNAAFGPLLERLEGALVTRFVDLAGRRRQGLPPLRKLGRGEDRAALRPSLLLRDGDA